MYGKDRKRGAFLRGKDDRDIRVPVQTNLSIYIIYIFSIPVFIEGVIVSIILQNDRRITKMLIYDGVFKADSKYFEIDMVVRINEQAGKIRRSGRNPLDRI